MAGPDDATTLAVLWKLWKPSIAFAIVTLELVVLAPFLLYGALTDVVAIEVTRSGAPPYTAASSACALDNQ